MKTTYKIGDYAIPCEDSSIAALGKGTITIVEEVNNSNNLCFIKVKGDDRFWNGEFFNKIQLHKKDVQ